MNSIPNSVVAKIQAIASDDFNAVHIFRALGERRPQKTIDLYRLKLNVMRGGVHLNDMQFLKPFEKLEKAGVGKLKVQQLPGHSTFEFSYSLNEVAKVGLSKVPSEKVGPLKAADSAPRTQADRLNVVCPVGDEFVTIPLPRSFGVKDAEALSKFLLGVARQNEAGQL